MAGGGNQEEYDSEEAAEVKENQKMPKRRNYKIIETRTEKEHKKRGA